MANKLYKEKQRYDDWLVIVMLSIAFVVLLYNSASYLWNPEITPAYAGISLALAAGIAYALWWLFNLRSKLTVTDKKIKFQLKGLLNTSEKIAWEDIVACTIVKTPGLVKWNRPKVTLSDEKFLSLGGRNGLMIETKGNKHYFIGCQNVEELQEALNSEDKIWELIEG